MEIATPQAIIVANPRSGTHLLQDALATHPDVHARDEFILHFLRMQSQAQSSSECLRERIFNNRLNLMNIGIVMYQQVPVFEKYCGSLSKIKIIHLLRNPHDSALSMTQMLYDKRQLGKGYRAHYRLGEVPPLTPKVNIGAFELVSLFQTQQEIYKELLKAHSNKIEIRYEDITCNRQITMIPKIISDSLLSFLGLKFFPLRSNLLKMRTF